MGHQRSGCWEGGGKEGIYPWGHMDAEDQGNTPGWTIRGKLRCKSWKDQGGAPSLRARGRLELGVLNLGIWSWKGTGDKKDEEEDGQQRH